MTRIAHEQSIESSGISQIVGSCLLGCVFLLGTLRKFSKVESARIRGGGQGDGGYRDAEGNLHGHYWIEAIDTEGRWVVDITADQFGGPPVLVIKAEESDRYVPGDQSLIDSHVDELISQISPDRKLV